MGELRVRRVELDRRNTAYYPVFQVQLMKKLLDLDTPGLARVQAATTWSWYLEGDRYFEGTRRLFTASDLATPLLNAYRLLARLPERRLHVESDQGRGLTQLQEADERPEVDALAATDGHGRVAIAVWHHCDDQYRRGTARVTVDVRHLPWGGGPIRLRHYRIDHAHSKSHSAWAALGRPRDPDAGQVAAIRAHEGLEVCAPDQVIDAKGGNASLSFDLPLPGVSLLELEAT